MVFTMKTMKAMKAPIKAMKATKAPMKAMKAMKAPTKKAMKAMKAPKKAMNAMKAMKAMTAPKAMKAMKAMKAPEEAFEGGSSTYTVEFPKKVFQVPNCIPKEFAKRVKMIEINTKGLDSIFYPLTQAEASNWVDPPIYSQMLNLRIKSAWDNTGNVVWNVCKEFSEKAFGGNEVPA
jgi:hypothetical protein